MTKYAFLFPGQGAQYPGMARDFYESFAIARHTFEEADALLKTPFSKLIFEGPAEVLTLTKNAQVAIYVASVAILRTLQEQFPTLAPAVCAGLSLGEYTALFAAGKLSFQEGLLLVQARAAYMNEACEKYPGTMQVVLGLEEGAIEEVLSQAGPSGQAWIANLNCPGQVVIAGTKEGISSVVEPLKQKGAKRVLPLDVSGAFHSGLMQEAREKLIPLIAQAHLQISDVDLVMNVPGDYVSDLVQIRKNMIEQVTSPVRWEKGIRAMMQADVDCYLEIGCGKTLAGMHKRIGVSEPILSIEKISDLEQIPAPCGV
jgi:[acyl-carrier-protein] S-malonyltransferase